MQLYVARVMKGKDELIWETRPVPQHARDYKEFSVAWEGGMGYFAEPPGTFALWLNDEKLIEIPAISAQNTAWFNADKTVSLKYERDASRSEMEPLDPDPAVVSSYAGSTATSESCRQRLEQPPLVRCARNRRTSIRIAHRNRGHRLGLS